MIQSQVKLQPQKVHQHHHDYHRHHQHQTSTLSFQYEAIHGAIPMFEDSFHVPQFVQRVLGRNSKTLMRVMERTAPWTDPNDPNLAYRGNPLNRQKAFLVNSPLLHNGENEEEEEEEGEKDVAQLELRVPPNVIPKYYYTGFQYASMLDYRPVEAMPEVHALKKQMEEHLRYNDTQLSLNHVILTNYRDAHDGIGFHRDKVLDIRPNSPIVSLSFGEMREFHIGKPHPENPKRVVFEKAIQLKSGDLFILGPLTNQLHLHAIVPVTSEKASSKRDPNATIKPRISVVMRDIASTTTLNFVKKHAKKVEEDRRQRNSKRKGEEEEEKNNTPCEIPPSSSLKRSKK